MNTTSAVRFDPPFYYSQRPRLIDGVPDHHVTLAVPILAYWSLSLFFHLLDISGWKWLERYRIHESEEVKKRNLVGRGEVILAVVFQQIIQTMMGFVWLEEEAIGGGGKGTSAMTEVVNGLQRWERLLEPEIIARVAWFMYWWGVPVFQFFLAMFFIDTWQYFLHRLMHVNKFLYKSFHSWHHRLYVPYAFGSLYNHPVEGFLLDTLGAALAEWVTGMTTRQAMLLFIVSTFKTVDDHCGYNFPYDPLQMLASNNADYHDIHHQAVGIKSNFAQPFFVHWDTLLGTRMTRDDVERRKKHSLGKKE
ncbi:sphingosine hydroxylase [Macrolepiota fuliginosa MF-IS2]|uniref:Sphingosine hydroxylase n=1 Tax=Macrolepiota fuliginosa MF-IS2 TaxID=1400762 RepID=A0A9P6C5M1_9AGAR|nr:sphingosine hydroxylase [Macrolepiota fuliginosa MF-IS2]